LCGEDLDFGGGTMGTRGACLASLASDGALGTFDVATSILAEPRLAVTDSGDVILTSEYGGTIALGGIEITPIGGNDLIAVSFLATTGTLAWASSLGGVRADRLGGVATDLGHVVVAGSKDGDGLIAEINSATGALTRVETIVGSSQEALQSILVVDGDWIVMGTFSDSLDLGAGMWTGAGAFLARLAP